MVPVPMFRKKATAHPRPYCINIAADTVLFGLAGPYLPIDRYHLADNTKEFPTAFRSSTMAFFNGLLEALTAIIQDKQPLFGVPGQPQGKLAPGVIRKAKPSAIQ
jgi:hypothetical protein